MIYVGNMNKKYKLGILKRVSIKSGYIDKQNLN